MLEKMTANPKPTILLVPGAWTPSDSFNLTRDLLTQAGYESVAVDNPSVGNEPADQTLETDVASLRNTLQRLIDQEKKDVVVVLHSYGTFETYHSMPSSSLTRNRRRSRWLLCQYGIRCKAARKRGQARRNQDYHLCLCLHTPGRGNSSRQAWWPDSSMDEARGKTNLSFRVRACPISVGHEGIRRANSRDRVSRFTAGRGEEMARSPYSYCHRGIYRCCDIRAMAPDPLRVFYLRWGWIAHTAFPRGDGQCDRCHGLQKYREP